MSYTKHFIHSILFTALSTQEQELLFIHIHHCGNEDSEKLISSRGHTGSKWQREDL